MIPAIADISATPSASRTASRHIPALDGVRGLAIALVMVHHFGMDAFPSAIVNRIAYSMWVGVDLFFVLSGFLITDILLKSKTSPHYFRNFYARRLLRIFPLYYGVIAVCLIFAAFHPPSRGIFREQGWFWLYATNIKMAVANDWIFEFGRLDLRHLWSLAVEEHFYLIWPALVLWLRPRRLLVVCFAIITASLALRLYFAHKHLYFAMHVLTPCRIDSMSAGAVLAVLRQTADGRKCLSRWAPIAGVICAVAILIVVLRERTFQPTSTLTGAFKYAFLTGIFSVLVWRAIQSPAAVLTWRSLRLIGKYSYGIYVYHHIIRGLIPYAFFSQHLGRGWTCGLIFFLTGSTLSCLVAFASWHLFEKHFLKLKRLFPRQ